MQFAHEALDLISQYKDTVIDALDLLVNLTEPFLQLLRNKGVHLNLGGAVRPRRRIRNELANALQVKTHFRNLPRRMSRITLATTHIPLQRL